MKNSKASRGETNSLICGTEIQPDEKHLNIPPKQYAIQMGGSNVFKDEMVLTTIGKYDFVKKNDGKIYRKGENGIEYPPIAEEDFEKIVKARQELNRKKSTRAIAQDSLEDNSIR